MQLFSSSSSSSATSSHFTLLPAAQSSHPSTSKFIFKIPTTKLLNSNPTLISIIPACSSKESPAPLSDTQQKELINRRNQVSDPEFGDQYDPDAFLVVRRPVMENSDEDDDDGTTRSSPIDKSLYDFAKKVAIFEPESTDTISREKKPPLTVNLDLALYKAKVLARNYQFQEAEKVLERCVYLWPEDGRPYVALGKVLSKQNKIDDARAVYEKGCQATQGENPYIWQCWAVLENKVGNIRKARELFDASTVADKKHVAAWHGWANLEIKQGNIKKARNLLAKALKFCGGNEYVYQTLALLEAKANRYEQARYLFNQATKCNPKSCASWLSWAQLEVQQRNHRAARQLFEKAVQASPKNRFAWHVWGVFEANSANIETGRKLLKIGHALNPRDPVLLQSLALIEYSNSTANLARVLFKRASELDPKHQPVWVAWGWMEWKEGNIATARELYQRALSIDSTSESAARCLQAWGVLEQRIGNLSTARRLFRSSLNINSQSYVTWMTWASLEEAQGNSGRAEEVRDLYFQQRTEVVDDASWVMGFLDVIDPAIDSVKRLLKLDQNPNSYKELLLRYNLGDKEDFVYDENASSTFDLDTFIREKLFLDPSKLDIQLDSSQKFIPRKSAPSRRVWRPENQSSTSKYQLQTGTTR